LPRVRRQLAGAVHDRGDRAAERPGGPVQPVGHRAHLVRRGELRLLGQPTCGDPVEHGGHLPQPPHGPARRPAGEHGRQQRPKQPDQQQALPAARRGALGRIGQAAGRRDFGVEQVVQRHRAAFVGG